MNVRQTFSPGIIAHRYIRMNHREKNDSYLAGLLDGDASVTITTGGGRSGKVLRIRVELTQCDESFLKSANVWLGGYGRILRDRRTNKYAGEPASTLRFDGANARGVLELMRKSCVLKHAQADVGIRFLDSRKTVDISSGEIAEIKEGLRRTMSLLNSDKSYEKRFERMNKAYIAGLFDAEGDASTKMRSGNGRSFRARITQRSAPDIAQHIPKALGFGRFSEGFRFVVERRNDVRKFSEEVAIFCRLPKRISQIERVKENCIFSRAV